MPEIRRIAGGRVLDVPAGAFHAADVLIEGGRIADVVPSGRPDGSQGDEDTVRAEGAFLLPGLIDCHVHLTLRGEDADPSANARRSDEEIAIQAGAAARRTVLAGITSVRDVGGWNHVEMKLRHDIEQGRAVGPRLFPAGRLLSMPTPAVAYYPGMYEVAAGREAVAEAARKQLERGAELIKVMATGAMLSPEDEDAGAVQYSREEMGAAVEAARAAGKHVAAHAHALAGIGNAVEAGAASVEHGTFADEDVLGRMAERGTFLVPTLSASAATLRDRTMAAALPRHVRERFERSAGIHAEAVRLAARLGVPIAMGTDAGTPANQHGENAQECVFLVTECGLTPAESIAAATMGAARLLGRESDLGALQPGRWADVIAVRANPLEDITELTRVVFVMKGGRVVRDDLG